jgi:hypothetical protein
MAKYRKKPVEIEAVQWLKQGDHLHVECYKGYYDEHDSCKKCGYLYKDHGWIKTLEGDLFVCPGDWVITGVHGEHYPCKSDIFEKTYEEVDE